MIRKIITEQLLEECPNCGAPRVTEEKICPYCGTVMTVRKIDTLYLSTVDKAEFAEFLESGEYAGILREKRRRKQVDIVSTVRPASWHDARSIVRLVAAGMFFLATVILADYLASENAGRTYTYVPAEAQRAWADVGAVVLLAMLTAFAGAALVMWSAASVKRYRNVLKYGKKYTAVVIMRGDELRGTYGAFDAAVGRSVPLKVRFELDGRPTVMLLTGPAGIEIGESITILGYGKDYVVAPRDAA